jgi:cation-transporting ATPase 13A3/4/5
MVVWCLDDYYVYATAIFITSAVAAITNVIQLRRSMEKLQKMATYICTVHLHIKTGIYLFYFHNIMQGPTSTVASTELVPGDIIEITDQFTLPCDLILLSGVAILNESVLTGESVPVIKTPIPENEVSILLK